MNILADVGRRLDRLSCFAELGVDAAELPSAVLGLSDRSVVEIARDLAAIAGDVARLQALVAGVAAHRSPRRAGQGGLAAGEGHASPASLIQDITGGSRGDALRQVRVGKALLEEAIEQEQRRAGGGADADPGAGGGVDAAGGADAEGADGPGSTPGGPGSRDEAPRPTFTTVLRDAHLGRRLTDQQHDVIRRGLGEPFDDAADTAEVWAVAAAGLIDDAASLTLEDLAVHARAVRDAIDPAGAEERYARRFENRSFRTWLDRDGQRRGSVVFDDEDGLWAQAILDAGLRPRRGGPRFMTDEERATGTRLRDDPRTNDQLAYDLLMSVMRAGAVADAKDVFGVRQPGVRMVVVKDPTGDDGSGVCAGPRDAYGRLLATGYSEDRGHPLAGSVIDRNLCMHGSTEVTVDVCGNPLDAGREQRLFQPKQRLALAARDGGCMWPGCDMPASYCESHHIDPVAQGGRTDIDRGILLCKYHHLLLHNRGWRITRDGKDAFRLHPPSDTGGPPTTLVAKAPWKWAWDPPPAPARPHWRAA
ncbi:HNH endonuclease signature motif containing protein [Microbacterium sp. MC2]